MKRNNPRANLSGMASYLLARTKDLSAAPLEKITRTSSKKPTPMVGVNENLTSDTCKLEDEVDVELPSKSGFSTVEYSSIDRSMAG